MVARSFLFIITSTSLLVPPRNPSNIDFSHCRLIVLFSVMRQQQPSFCKLEMTAGIHLNVSLFFKLVSLNLKLLHHLLTQQHPLNVGKTAPRPCATSSSSRDARLCLFSSRRFCRFWQVHSPSSSMWRHKAPAVLSSMNAYMNILIYFWNITKTFIYQKTTLTEYKDILFIRIHILIQVLWNHGLIRPTDAYPAA